ncbi:MAG: hypothetical protein KDA45_11770, partial [Planctomycetales bacterium]|nr:hypothetical protein [Planctomycetales bacterium]
QLRLQDGGAVAIVHLVDQLLDGGGPVEPAMLAGTIAEFGPDGIEALKAACMVREPQRLSRVLLALAELPSKQFSVELGAGLASGVLPAERQAELAERLNDKYGKLPSLPAIHAFLNKSFDRELAQYQVSRTTQGGLFDTIWRPTPDRRSVQLVEGQTQDRRLEAVARLAVHRLQLSLTTPGESVDCGAVLLQRAYQSHASMELGEVEGHLLTRLPEAQTREAGYWIQVFERADEWQMHGGAIRALQMLVASAPGEYLVPLDFLSELLNDSRPVIRYTALQSLYELDPQSPYLGAEKALAVAMEMTQLAGGPQPLVVGLQSELRQAAQQQLKMQTGTSGLSANSARNALLALAGTTPIEIIVIVDRVADQSLFEFLQRLRSSQKAQSLPIAVLTDELYQHERQWIENTPGIVSGVLSRNPEYMGRVVQRLYDTLDTAPLSAGDRAHFAAVSSRFLTRLASNRDKYAFYPLADWSGHLEALGENVSLETQLTVLAGIGSAVSQRKLSALAANSALPAADRYEAARALGKSVRRFGMNLTEQDVLQTYELYNTLGPGDPAAAKSLGLALDVLEAYAGKGAWPEGL